MVDREMPPPSPADATGGPASPTAEPVLARRAAVAVGLGTLIEVYDFAVYAFVAVTIAPIFFPSDVPGVSILLTFAVFGTAYVVRPLGGWFFGWLGDSRGRKPALVASVLLMGAACALFGLLPTYEQVGILAPVLLVVVRLVQGFSVGGEVGGGATYVGEFAPDGKRGWFTALLPAGATMGSAVAAAVVGLMSVLTTDEQMVSWGWRIPFLVAIPLALLCLRVRSRLEDTPGFVAAEKKSGTVRSPLLTVLRERPGSVVRVLALTAAMSGAGYISTSYFNTYLISTLGFGRTEVLWTSAVSIFLGALTYPFSGKLADRLGRKPTLTLAFVVYLVIAWPGFALLGATSSLVVVALVFIAFIAVSGTVQAAAFPVFTELFPLRIRYTGVSLGYNVGVIIAGGMAPYIAAQLVVSTGNAMSPAYWVMFTAVVGLLTVRTLRETAHTSLPT
ncbi:MFS transporter [Pseudonocardia sp. CNS-139]|nr:MFS transporter [Pseudonocardia sp. CNS-139]